MHAPACASNFSVDAPMHWLVLCLPFKQFELALVISENIGGEADLCNAPSHVSEMCLLQIHSVKRVVCCPSADRKSNMQYMRAIFVSEEQGKDAQDTMGDLMSKHTKKSEKRSHGPRMIGLAGSDIGKVPPVHLVTISSLERLLFASSLVKRPRCVSELRTGMQSTYAVLMQILLCTICSVAYSD